MYMKCKQKNRILSFVTLIFCACGGGGNPAPSQTAEIAGNTAPLTASAHTVEEIARAQRSLDELAELERSGSYFQGLALAESGLRETIGDYAGAVAAAYKELAWAYGQGNIQKADLEQGLLNVLGLNNGDVVTQAASAIIAFTQGQWADAQAALRPLFIEQEEPDGFGRWMLLVCQLEKNREDRQAAAAYRAIRARYTQYPEYWYRGARAFSGAVAADYAERCIGAAPQGPFAGECRAMLAAFSGLKKEDGPSLKTKFEIDDTVTRSINQGDPGILNVLIPLISLPDNPYTIYAVSALRALASVQKYRDFFNEKTAVSNGRLAERLAYICRG
jgi:hypothetical protein